MGLYFVEGLNSRLTELKRQRGQTQMLNYDSLQYYVCGAELEMELLCRWTLQMEVQAY
jgi:hypothetical protein